MIDTMQEIEILENVIIALQEGASDEKRMAITDLERMMQRKQVEVAERDRNHDLKEQLVPPGDPFFGTEEDA